MGAPITSLVLFNNNQVTFVAGNPDHITFFPSGNLVPPNFNQLLDPKNYLMTGLCSQMTLTQGLQPHVWNATNQAATLDLTPYRTITITGT